MTPDADAPAPLPPPPEPEGRPQRRAYVYALWGAAGSAFVLATVAALTTGPVRRVAILLMMVAALAMAWASNSRIIAPEPDLQLKPMGGAGYHVQVPRHIRLLNAVITVFYNAGIMVVVLAVLAVLADLGPQVTSQTFQASPLLVAFYLLMLAASLHWRIAVMGGVLRTWYTRLHLWLMYGYVTVLLVLGAFVVPMSPVQLGALALYESHLMVFLLVAMLAVGTQAFLAAELPTLFDLAQYLVRPRATKEKKREGESATPPFVYAGFLALGGALLVWIVATQLDLGFQIGDLDSNTALYLVITAPVLLVIFFGVSAVMVWRRSRQGLYKKKIPTRLRNDLLVYGASGLAGSVCAFFLYKVLTGDITALGPIDGKPLAMDLTALTVVITTGPIGWYLHRQNRRVDDIEDRLPDFLNDLAETRRAGLTLTSALQSVALSDYGALTKEVRKMAQQVAWGVSFTEAMQQFAERVNTALVKRSAFLIIEASKTGGSVAEILKAAARDAYELKSLEAERKTTMLTYVLVIYVVFVVFLVVLGVLDANFIPEVLAAAEAQEAAAGAGGGFIQGSPDPGLVRFLYFNAAMVQSVGNGIVAGVLGESRITAGLRHVAVMAFLGWLVFRLLLGG